MTLDQTNTKLMNHDTFSFFHQRDDAILLSCKNAWMFSLRSKLGDLLGISLHSCPVEIHHQVSETPPASFESGCITCTFVCLPIMYVGLFLHRSSEMGQGRGQGRVLNLIFILKCITWWVDQTELSWISQVFRARLNVFTEQNNKRWMSISLTASEGVRETERERGEGEGVKFIHLKPILFKLISVLKGWTSLTTSNLKAGKKLSSNLTVILKNLWDFKLWI